MIPEINVLENPQGWRSVRYKYLATTSKGRLPPTEDQGSTASESQVAYLSMEYLRGDSEATIFVDPKGLVVARDNDVLVLWDGSNAGEFLRAKSGVVSSTAALVEAISINRDYLFWISKAVEPVLRMYTNGMGIPHVDGGFLKDLRVLSPDLHIQRNIANDLDRETIRIDALVEEKERMILLLEEKRAALVSHVVSRGLDPGASLQYSNRDWLGDIPVHWNMLRLKFLLNGIEQGSSPQCYSYPAESGEWGVLKSGCTNGGIFREEANKLLPPDIEPFDGYQVHINDVLMSRASGSVDLIGSVAYVENEPTARLLLSDKTFRLLLKHEIIDYRFLVFAMGANFLRHQIRVVISGAEGLANNIAKSDILEFSLAVPPLSEQKEICLFIDKQLNRNGKLKLALKDSIALLKERRTALITATVTGQIPLEEMTL